jgi:transaldolase
MLSPGAELRHRPGAVGGADLPRPVFERDHGLKGRISIQTNPAFYRDAKRIVAQALHFDSLALNMGEAGR